MNDRLDAATGKFTSDCDDASFCSEVGGANGTCQPRQCRRDEFPFGFANATVPPLCPRGSYCPDEGSGCRPLVAVGQPCQVGRDEQCAPPGNWQDLASGLNANGSVCLNSACTWANMTLGQPCNHEVMVYKDSTGLSNTIIRHNCHTPRFYCHTGYNVCIPTKILAQACGADQECHSYNCGQKGVCIDERGTPNRVKAWQLVITGLSVVSVMIAIVVLLTLVHKRLRLRRLREIREYYEEQVTLRRALASLHSAAADQHEKEKWFD
ncbi:hypothetical protein BD309DRAFT_886109 [Dichomitus squalens]|nr:hypothetical protein BD309DRAFT_886109 [Dichomitus squalens]